MPRTNPSNTSTMREEEEEKWRSAADAPAVYHSLLLLLCLSLPPVGGRFSEGGSSSWPGDPVYQDEEMGVHMAGVRGWGWTKRLDD